MLYRDGQNNKNATPIRPPVLFVLLLSAATSNLFAVNVAEADFSTNFSTATFRGGSLYNSGSIVCPFADPNGCQGQIFGNGDPTAFAEETINVAGTVYWHVIVGDPASGFAQESYTRYGKNNAYGIDSGSSADGTSLSGAFSLDSGGNENLTSTCGGFQSCIEQSENLMAQKSNIGKPLAGPHISGDGSGNPSYTVFHMILISADGDMSLDVDKPFLDTKPRISQTVQDSNMTSTFVADMRGIGYQDMNNPIGIINDTVIDDPTIPGATGAANFTMANAQDSTVTAGRFTFTPGTGWNTPNGWDAPNSSFGLGSYSYYGAPTGFDVFTVDWREFFDYGQNILNCTREGSISSNVTGVATRISMGQGGGFSCPGHP